MCNLWRKWTPHLSESVVVFLAEIRSSKWQNQMSERVYLLESEGWSFICPVKSMAFMDGDVSPCTLSSWKVSSCTQNYFTQHTCILMEVFNWLPALDSSLGASFLSFWMKSFLFWTWAAPGEGTFFFQVLVGQNEDGLLTTRVVEQHSYVVAYRRLMTPHGEKTREKKVTTHVANVVRMTGSLAVPLEIEVELSGTVSNNKFQQNWNLQRGSPHSGRHFLLTFIRACGQKGDYRRMPSCTTSVLIHP